MTMSIECCCEKLQGEGERITSVYKYYFIVDVEVECEKWNLTVECGTDGTNHVPP